jgi:glycosyltransferase involved in cell wall biosynthesis
MITYGHARFIEQSILSIIEQQANFEFELCIADDCSPDDTQEVVLALKARHPKGYRINYKRHKENVGVMVNFTSLMESCNTPYLALCEGDDFWQDENKLQKQVDFLQANPDFVLSCHDAIDIDTNGELSPTKRLAQNEMRDFTGKELQRGAYVLTLTMCFRNVIKQFPPEFDFVNNGDLFLTVLLGEFGKCHFHTDIKHAAYRVHPGGMWSLKSQVDRWKMSAVSYYYFAKYFKRVKKNELALHFAEMYTKRGEEIFGFYIKNKLGRNAWSYVSEQRIKLNEIAPSMSFAFLKRYTRLAISIYIQRSSIWKTT